MVWFRRDPTDKEIYKPSECPAYGVDSELFSIKFHHGGHFIENRTEYIGGSFDYIDLCDCDTMSMIELLHMSKECGVTGAPTFFYKWPQTDMARGLHTLESDADVLEMCGLLPPSKVIYVFSITTKPLMVLYSDGFTTQEFAPSQDRDVEFVDPTTDQFELVVADLLHNKFGDVVHDTGDAGDSEGDSDEDYNPNDERNVFKTRTKSSKKSPCKKLDDAQGGANQSGGGHVSEGVETAKASAKTRKSIGEGTQGGVFRKKQPITKVVENTPLGIQPQKTNTKGQGTATTMENIEARRRAMQANLRKNPVWKI
ncbi:hypothetical protein OROHE_016053 [Orobanche hederae]